MFSGNTLNGVVTANLGSGNDNFIGRATNTFNDEFSLAAGNGHSDNVEASGFVQHLKLPHYVDFQSELVVVRALRDEIETRNRQASLSQAAE